jgi:hypothetical protein
MLDGAHGVDVFDGSLFAGCQNKALRSLGQRAPWTADRTGCEGLGISTAVRAPGAAWMLDQWRRLGR